MAIETTPPTGTVHASITCPKLKTIEDTHLSLWTKQSEVLMILWGNIFIKCLNCEYHICNYLATR